MISILLVQKFFDLDELFVFYGRLKLALDGPCPSFSEPGTSTFGDVIQGSRLVALINLYSLRCLLRWLPLIEIYTVFL